MARVLIVEDDDAVRQLLRALIENEGHEVLAAATSEQAYALLESRPDAAFVDVDMPDQTGPDFLLRLRRHPSAAGIPAMFATAHPDRVGRLTHSGLAARQLLEKPFRKAEVVQALSTLLGRG